MPKDFDKTHVCILESAKKEFLGKGFANANLREISKNAGVTTGGLYRHFADKEALFAALVDPVLEEFYRQADMFKDRDYDLMEQGRLDTMWESGADLDLLLEMIYQYFDGFKLLICCSEGTAYAGFIHDFVMMEQRETLAFLEAARLRGVPVRDILPEELHLLLSAYASAIFEVVVHDFTHEAAQHYLKTLQAFFYPGWRAVLGL
ncbi:regulatory protein TetR [Syntrophobotulus glycolicus DSM 8271]|uniref:Regulatory protein TetR n=1 Tax=Syntrophobotulus glycolicus (strain DSM 8271 / FlGlyR) TaxID=645991 RepID=F0SXP0_SYNGF|nr:TetR/AcrR family transcriptional regulator [Syntrophobotulus glycolicus]ADY55873.1 regulatory protein TetR [Syntrophobotulus glycolicus DSM 8271]